MNADYQNFGSHCQSFSETMDEAMVHDYTLKRKLSVLTESGPAEEKRETVMDDSQPLCFPM